MSPGWIWRMPKWNTGQADDVSEKDAFNVSICIEWAKTKARAERWQEELFLVEGGDVQGH